jgi:hypothetical protein
MAYPEAIQVLSSSLLSLDEIGELAGLTITSRENPNGTTHATGCRHISTKATAPPGPPPMSRTPPYLYGVADLSPPATSAQAWESPGGPALAIPG